MIDVALSIHLDNFAVGYFPIIIRFVAEFMARIIRRKFTTKFIWVRKFHTCLNVESIVFTLIMK